MGKHEKVPGVGAYGGPAGGWGALQAVARALRAQMALNRETRALRRVNQPQGFDCPGCAWPDPRHASSFEFCENGAKAVAWEATRKRADLEFFASHSASELWNWTDFALEDAGRLTHPMIYDAASDHFVPIAWEDAFARIGGELRKLPDPNMAEFYTSGRTSNEAAFMYQVFVREFGTNNFPDCSNMCHEATSVGLPDSIGVGKGTVTLEDFDHADLVFCMGHNPGTNHPRMLSHAARRLQARRHHRGVQPVEGARPGALPVAAASGRDADRAGDEDRLRLPSGACRRRRGSHEGPDEGLARPRGQERPPSHRSRVHRRPHGRLRRPGSRHQGDEVEGHRALLRPDAARDREHGGDLRQRQERHLLLRHGPDAAPARHAGGAAARQPDADARQIGRAGAGICPLRGHSNVQGDRTVGITEIPNDELLDRLEATFGFKPPRAHGHGAVEAIKAIAEGRSKALICMGGNLPVAMSDPEVSFAAMRKLDLAVHIATKLNRSHLLLAKTSIILPCLGRTELDEQETGPQSVTVEDSMSVVHASAGRLKPASPDLKSEPAIVAGIAKATLPNSKVDWDGFVADYNVIRDAIEKVFPAFADFNARVREPGGFRLHIAASERQWLTPNGKANFIVFDGPRLRYARRAIGSADARHHPQPRSVQYDHLRFQRSLSRHQRPARRHLHAQGRPAGARAEPW